MKKLPKTSQKLISFNFQKVSFNYRGLQKMKDESPTKLVVESPPHVTGRMTKNLVMKYTFVALCIIAAISYISYGFDSIIISAISVLVAVACDYLLSLIMGDKGPLNIMSAAVFGLVVAMSYSLGLPVWETEATPVLAGGIEQYLYPALISAVGLVVFKKIQGLAGRKYVNPTAISKLLVLGLLFLPIFSSVSALLPADHAVNINLQNPLSSDIFGYYLVTCYGGPSVNTTNPYNFGTFENPLPDVLYTMLVVKQHGWTGGFSSILVMAVGIVLFAICRGYIKWRITLTYLVTTAVFSVVFGFIYGGDIILRLLFHLFMGSSIFLAFFMATDPATTPLTYLGQIIFGVGLAILTMIIQVYMGFFGGSILALVIMNLTVPLLDQVGVHKPFGRR
jgi:electron transport complex protein RnfD